MYSFVDVKVEACHARLFSMEGGKQSFQRYFITNLCVHLPMFMNMGARALLVWHFLCLESAVTYMCI